MSDTVLGTMITLLFLSFFAGIIVFAVYMQRRTYRKCWANFVVLADHLGIPAPDVNDKKLVRSMPFLAGQSKGAPFMIRMEVRGSGKSRTYYVHFEWGIRSLNGNTLTIYREHFFAKIGKALGMNDIQTGFESFDKKFILRSNNESFAQSVFTDKLCAQFEEGAADFGAGFYLKENKLSYAQQGYVSTDAMRERIIRLVDLSRVLVDAIDKKSPGRG